MALVTEVDLEVSLQRPLTDTEQTYFAELAARAERKLLVRIPHLLDKADKDKLYAQRVADVEAEMLARVFRATDGGLYTSESEGDYSYRRNLQVASGLLDVLDREWIELGQPNYGFGTTQTLSDYAGRRYGWLPKHFVFQYGSRRALDDIRGFDRDYYSFRPDDV